MGEKGGRLKAARARMGRILAALKKTYPSARCSLNYVDPYQLIVSTILSAQCTDERVNKVTPRFFERFPDARALARADLKEVEALIQSTGFFRNKAKSLVESARAVVEKHGGQIPKTLEELTKLRGVGRKTANVVLGNAFGIPGLVVDTHVGRLARRLGFTKSSDPVKIEAELMPIVPREDWTLFSHLLIFHGRERCAARRPDCPGCEIAEHCEKRGVPKAIAMAPSTRKKKIVRHEELVAE